MADDGIKYETKTVRAVRGTEARTAAKWEKDGWEVVSQSRGKLQTEIALRRPKPSTPRAYFVGGGIAVVALVAIIVAGILTEHGDAPPKAEAEAAPTASAATSAGGQSSHTSSSATGSTTAKPDDVVLTVRNSQELAAILKLGDNCNSSIEAFAKKHQGQTIAFDGSIGAMNHHDDASTRYDILIGPGDYSEAKASGPTFQFRDVNTTFDLHYTQDPPDKIGGGTELHVKATVDEYQPASCLFLLDPVETTVL